MIKRTLTIIGDNYLVNRLYPATVWFWVLIKVSNKLQCYLVMGPNKAYLLPDSYTAIIRNGNSISAHMIEDTIEND
jgi:hypothetical protein